MEINFYVIEYRHVKKNVETFGLKEWFEGIVLYCYGTTTQPEKAKVLQNLGKIQDIGNSVPTKNRQGIVNFRPLNAFTNLDNLIMRGKSKAEYHGLVDSNDLVVYSKISGILPINEQ